MRLADYPVGTRVQIGARSFKKISTGSFWREDNAVPGNCVARPAASLEALEQRAGPHCVLALEESRT